jgi:hypothetical protein
VAIPDPELEPPLDPDPEPDPELDPEPEPELEPELLAPELELPPDPELDPELEPEPELDIKPESAKPPSVVREPHAVSTPPAIANDAMAHRVGNPAERGADLGSRGDAGKRQASFVLRGRPVDMQLSPPWGLPSIGCRHDGGLARRWVAKNMGRKKVGRQRQ